MTAPLTTRQNANAIHRAEQAAQGFNMRVAVSLTRQVGSMWTAYLFSVIALLGLLGIFGWLNTLTVLLVTWFSQTFCQYVLLPVIMVGQNVLNRKQELQADAQFVDIEHILAHLDAQDVKILEILQKLEEKHD